MWFDNQFEKDFRRLSDRFFAWDDVFENKKSDQVLTYGPYYYGYEMALGSDGKPHVREWGNVRPSNTISSSDVRELFVDETINEKENIVKLVTEMPGIEKSDIKVNVIEGAVSISAQRGDRKYSAEVPIKYKVDQNSAKAKYTNGVLELTFSLAKEEPKGKLVSVE